MEQKIFSLTDYHLNYHQEHPTLRKERVQPFGLLVQMPILQ